MLASYRWLCELSGVDAPVSEVAERLTQLGLEVEGVQTYGEGLEHVVVAEVRGAAPVPGKDKLRLVTVFDGEGERQVICGAPNVPDPGGRVVLAMPGAVLPGGMEIADREVGGVLSRGMLCSETELGIGTSSGGILVLRGGDPGKPGQPVAEALSLRDSVLEIGLTPNRPDCLGHIGLARELALAFGVPFRAPSPGLPTRLVAGHRLDPQGIALVGDDYDRAPVDTLTLVDPRPGVPTDLAVHVYAPERCPRYAAGIVQGVRVRPSPFWLRYRLHVLGVRSIDNIVDVTNLVLFELGHPIHAFDLARLRGSEIVVRPATPGEQMATLDGELRTFTPDDLLICDGEGPIAVAGVMGGADSEIRADTRDVLIEVAYFDPRSIRRTSRRLGLHTDSSHRFERGVDPNGVPWAMRRAATLMVALADGAACALAHEHLSKPIRGRQIGMDPAYAGRLLGVSIPETEARRALEGVGCSISPGEERGWRVTAPTWRPDLTRPEDLVEEVARVRGYDSIPTELPRVLPSGRGVAPRLRAVRRLREAAVDNGLLEAVNFAFVSRDDLARAAVSTDAVVLKNPLSEERAVMRTSLLPGLLADVARARRHGTGAVTIFELARSYRPRPNEALPAEPLSLAVALAGPRVDHVGEVGPLDFYDGKGALASIVEGALGISLCAVADASLDEDAPYLHPRRRARLRVGERDVGLLGEIHPDIGEAHDLDVRMIFGELDVDALLAAAAQLGQPRAAPLPRFPSVQRDVNVTVAEATMAADVSAELREAAGTLAEDVELVDVYRGQGIAEGEKRLTYRIVYRDPEATLTDKRVEKAQAEVGKAAQRLSLGRVRE